MFILNFRSSQFLRLPRPCNKSRGQKKMKPKSFHQYSWNSEVETTWINLICWPYRTSSTVLHKVCVRKVRGKNWCKNWRKNMTSLQSRGSLRPFRVQTKGIFPHKNFLFPFPSTELWSKQHFWPKILEFLTKKDQNTKCQT